MVISILLIWIKLSLLILSNLKKFIVDSDNRIWDSWESYKDIDNETWDPWENYTDSQNGILDSWEDYIDLPPTNLAFDFEDQPDENGFYNGICDYTGSVQLDGAGNLLPGDFESQECEPFQDGNGIYDEGEPYIKGNVGEYDFNDRNGNGICDFTGNVLIDDGGEININTFSSQECEPFQDGNGIFDEGYES